MALAPGLLLQTAKDFRLQAGVDQLGEVFLLDGSALGLEDEAILEGRQLPLLGHLVGGGEQHAQAHWLRHAVLVELALVDDRQQNVQNGRVRLEDFIEETQPGGRQLALLAADVATLAQLEMSMGPTISDGSVKRVSMYSK